MPWGLMPRVPEHIMDTKSELQRTMDALVQAGKGLLAADESGPTIAKRFEHIGVPSLSLIHI